MNLILLRCQSTVIALILLSIASAAIAERAPVLRQINVPHDYYFREMYLPQVSSGPQAPAWGNAWRRPGNPGLDHATLVRL